MSMAQRIENIIEHSDESKYEGIVTILENWNTNQWFWKIWKQVIQALNELFQWWKQGGITGNQISML